MNRIVIVLCIILFSYFQILAQVNRSYNGVGNNLTHENWGAAKSTFHNVVSNGFLDLISVPNGQNLENPRVISNILGSQSDFIPNKLNLSDFVWGWGQFLDHDINLSDDNRNEDNSILIPNCESLFDPNCTGTVVMRMFRSISDPNTGTNINNPRQNINDITSFVDGSGVYGSDFERSEWLRTHINGKLKMSTDNLLPWNTIDGEFESAVDSTAPFMVLDGFPLPEKYFVGGDIRINEQPGLTSFHTLWVREHNRLCDELIDNNPNWSDETLFQRARKMIGAMIQSITYQEFLPSIGVILENYNGYDDDAQPNIMNVFSAAAYRFGHTMVNGRLVRYEESGSEWSFGAIDLRNGFFNPTIVRTEGGIEPFFRGLAAQKHQEVDPLIMDDIRNFLFGPPGAGGIDLLSINIARGRERGLPDFNTIRKDFQLETHADFNSMTSDIELRLKLSTIYETVDDVDPWIGFMSEDHLLNSIMGEALNTVLKVQFTALRDGDRYYYENDHRLTSDQVNEIKNTKLSEVILRNTTIEKIQQNVFVAVPRDQLSAILFPFPDIKNIKLRAFPNPVQKHFNLVLDVKQQTKAILRITDQSGRLVESQNINLFKGNNTIEFSLSDELANGLYIITLESSKGIGKLKIIKQKQ